MNEDQSLPIEAGDEVVAEAEVEVEAQEEPQGELDAETESEATDGEAPEGEPEDGEDGTESKSKARRERRKAELARLREAEAEASRKAEERKREVERLRAEAEKLPQPKLENFRDYDEYQAALMAYHSMKAVDERDRQRLMHEAEIDARRAAEARQMQAYEAARNWEAQKAEARTKYPDFEAVALDNSVPISDELAAAIKQSDVAADVAYFLGKNPAQAKFISALAPIEMARAVGYLEASVSAPKPKTVSAAPAPIKPVQSKASAIPDPDSLDNEQWRKLRNSGKLK